MVSAASTSAAPGCYTSADLRGQKDSSGNSTLSGQVLCQLTALCQL